MIDVPQVAALNHLLKGQGWARERLRPFAGKLVLFRLAPLPELGLRILDSGLVESSAKDAPADLTVTIQPAALPRLLAGDLGDGSGGTRGPGRSASTVQLLFRETSGTPNLSSWSARARTASRAPPCSPPGSGTASGQNRRIPHRENPCSPRRRCRRARRWSLDEECAPGRRIGARGETALEAVWRRPRGAAAQR